ncbi:hypothetical protein ACFFX0_32725 [Citricoccus parietis]|uniref:Uncharacterized protein n=1 Tax=Citricoccus parietis TaxID=592307 RepID=A0ABV5G9T7_9MICC
MLRIHIGQPGLGGRLRPQPWRRRPSRLLDWRPDRPRWAVRWHPAESRYPAAHLGRSLVPVWPWGPAPGRPQRPNAVGRSSRPTHHAGPRAGRPRTWGGPCSSAPD